MKFIFFCVINLFLISNLIFSLDNNDADETWVVSNIRGVMHYSPDFKFEESKLAQKKLIISFSENSGMVSGTDSKFIKLDENTLIGLSTNGKGAALYEIYQINRKHKKMHLTITRVGSETILPNFPDKAGAYVGDAKLVSND